MKPIRLPILALACVAALGFGAEEAGAEPVVLLTAFTAFAGRGVNGSETVATALDQRVIAGARVHILVLPVQWGEPERQLPAAVTKWKPALLLGLGEGWPGHVAVERVARNRAAHNDEAGAPPPATLAVNAPMTRAFRLDHAATWFAGSAVPVQLSDDAGDYLCNNLFYVAMAQPAARAGFVHLPPQGEVASAAYATPLLPIIIGLIEHNLTR